MGSWRDVGVMIWCDDHASSGTMSTGKMCWLKALPVNCCATTRSCRVWEQTDTGLCYYDIVVLLLTFAVNDGTRALFAVQI